MSVSKLLWGFLPTALNKKNIFNICFTQIPRCTKNSNQIIERDTKDQRTETATEIGDETEKEAEKEALSERTGRRAPRGSDTPEEGRRAEQRCTAAGAAATREPRFAFSALMRPFPFVAFVVS